MYAPLRQLSVGSACLVALGCGAPADDEELDAAAPDEATLDASGAHARADALHTADVTRADAPDAADVTRADVPRTDVTRADASDAADVARTDAPDAGPAWSPPVERGAVTFPYRAYQCGYSVRSVSPGVRSAQFHADTSGAAPRPRNLHLTFAGDPAMSVVIQWSTDAATAGSEVRFGESAAALDRVARGFSFTYAGASGRRQHEVHLCGLSPGRTYYYDAGGSAVGGRSARYRFVTAPSAPTAVRAIVAGDSRSNPSRWAGVARRALAEGADLLLLSGDAVADGASQAQWDALFDASPELFATLPAVWSNGNHEYLAEPYLAQMSLPDNGGARGVEQWYALTYGPLRIVALNDTVAASTDISIAQVDFLRATLSSVDRARTPWVLGLHHQPMYTTSSSHGSNATVRGAWAPLYDRFHVNVDIAGHVHSYESTHSLRGGTRSSEGTVVPAAMGTRYFNFGGGGAPLYGFSGTRSWIRLRESTRGYAVLAGTATTLTWTAKRDDGTVIETIDLAR